MESEPPIALTRSLIETTGDDHIEALLVDYVLGLRQRAPNRLDTLPVACQAYFIALTMDGQVLNGGFNQFWFNSPEFAADAAQALEFLELPEAAELARQASTIYETVRLKYDAARELGTVEAFVTTYEGAPFEALDDAYNSREAEWRQGRIRYLRQNTESFVHL